MPCGIAGFVGTSDEALLQRMLKVQSHRGPDSTGVFVDSGMCMGTDRLSIIDLNKGNQPLHNEDGTIWLSFNGEIYNYVELRTELEGKGHRFSTDTDTETVIHAYEEWGAPTFLSKLRGMFGLALWDSNKKSILLARDRFGKKPLYYTLVDGVLVFSSELKGLLQYPGIRREIDFEALDYFFTYFYIPSPFSIFRGIWKLQPGQYLTQDQDGIHVNPYWTLPSNAAESREEVAIEELFKLITDSVRIRLRSDVPVGAYLSGGLDSGVVVSLMSKMKDDIRTVTVGFEEDDDHITYGRLVADSLDTDHREYVSTPDSLKILPKLLWHFDEPFADPSLIPTYDVARLMRENVKVALTGDGGDEMFLGYSFMRDSTLERIYISLPSALQRAGCALVIGLPGNVGMKKLALNAREKHYGSQNLLERYVSRTTIFTPEMLQSLYGEERSRAGSVSPTLEFLKSALQGRADLDPYDAITLATVRGYLSDMVLTKVDRMSMAVSLEPRCPLLDHVLAEYAGTLSSKLKYRNGVPKYILKKMALEKKLLPRKVIFRKKVGFGPPVARWMAGEWRDVSAQILDVSKKNKILNERYVSGLSRNPSLNSTKLFGILVFSLWYSLYMVSDGTEPLSMDKIVGRG